MMGGARCSLPKNPIPSPLSLSGLDPDPIPYNFLCGSAPMDSGAVSCKQRTAITAQRCRSSTQDRLPTWIRCRVSIVASQHIQNAASISGPAWIISIAHNTIDCLRRQTTLLLSRSLIEIGLFTACIATK